MVYHFWQGKAYKGSILVLKDYSDDVSEVHTTIELTGGVVAVPFVAHGNKHVKDYKKAIMRSNGSVGPSHELSKVGTKSANVMGSVLADWFFADKLVEYYSDGAPRYAYLAGICEAYPEMLTPCFTAEYSYRERLKSGMTCLVAQVTNSKVDNLAPQRELVADDDAPGLHVYYKDTGLNGYYSKQAQCMFDIIVDAENPTTLVIDYGALRELITLLEGEMYVVQQV